MLGRGVPKTHWAGEGKVVSALPLMLVSKTPSSPRAEPWLSIYRGRERKQQGEIDVESPSRGTLPLSLPTCRSVSYKPPLGVLLSANTRSAKAPSSSVLLKPGKMCTLGSCEGLRQPGGAASPRPAECHPAAGGCAADFSLFLCNSVWSQGGSAVREHSS